MRIEKGEKKEGGKKEGGKEEGGNEEGEGYGIEKSSASVGESSLNHTVHVGGPRDGEGDFNQSMCYRSSM